MGQNGFSKYINVDDYDFSQLACHCLYGFQAAGLLACTPTDFNRGGYVNTSPSSDIIQSSTFTSSAANNAA